MAVQSYADVVVIGAGLGGLGAAVTVADAGRSVVVLEHAQQPGGYAVVFERPPFRFDASLHALDGMAPGGGNDRLLRRLGVADQVTMTRLDPLYVVRDAAGDVAVPADFLRYEVNLVDRFPSERVGVRAWFDDCRDALSEMHRLRQDVRADRLPTWDQMAEHYPTVTRLAGQTWQDATAERVSDPTLAGLLMMLWAYTGTPPSRLSALMGTTLVANYGLFGGWYPVGGAAAIPRALERRLLDAGGSIEYGQTVTSIEVRGGRAVAVHTAQGRTVACQALVSNAATPSLPDLLSPGSLPEHYVERLQGPPAAASSVSVYLGLDRDVFAEHGLPHEVFVPAADPDDDYAAGLAGDWANTLVVATDYTHVDPGCAPDGGAVVTLTAPAALDHAGTWGTSGDGTDPTAAKAAAADAIVAVADAAIPGLADAVVLREVATPVTNLRYTLNPGGSWAGYEATPQTVGFSALGPTTPLPNLFLAGAWTGAFGQTAALRSGAGAAGLAETYLTETAPVGS